MLFGPQKIQRLKGGAASADGVSGGGSQTFCPFKGFGSTEPLFLPAFGNPQPAAHVSAGKRSCGELVA